MDNSFALKSQADAIIRTEKLDGIGPARYGELDQLYGLIITQLSH
jgi:hypothetical protein